MFFTMPTGPLKLFTEAAPVQMCIRDRAPDLDTFKVLALAMKAARAGGNIPTCLLYTSNAVTTYTISVTSQDTCRNIAEKLKALNLVDDAEQFRIYMGQKGADHFIADGEQDVYKRQL